MVSSTVKAAALKAVERKECSGRPPPADLSKWRIEPSAAFSSELRSCVMVLPERSGVMTSKMTVDFPVLVPPVLGESVQPAAPRGYERVTGALDACSCGPRARVCSERLDLNMELVNFGVDSSLSDLARTHERQRKGSIRPFNA